MPDRQFPDYPSAAKRLIIDLTEGSSMDVPALEVVQSTLDKRLRSRFSTLNEADRADAISETMISLLVSARKGQIDPEGRPGGYIWKAVENWVLDQLRRSPGRTFDIDEEGMASEDDAIAAYLDAESSAQEVEETIALLARQGEHRANQIIGGWLELAERLERAPTTREVGDAMGVSHDTVARYLKVFRGALLKARTRRQLR